MTIPAHTVTVGDANVKQVTFNNTQPFSLMAGPCVLESRDHAFFMAEKLINLTTRLKIPFVYKTSFDKANRTSSQGFRGLDFDEALRILSDLRDTFKVPLITDVHLPEQCQPVADVVDILQIPAYLCRQTDLLKAAADTGQPINVKKGQFLAPHDMINVVKKLEGFNHRQIMLCERGVTFGYNNLVSDMRALTIMKTMEYPVVFDVTHSVQRPGAGGDKSTGQREFVPTLAKAAAAIGVGAFFFEVHQDPDNAPSDGPNMVKLHEFEELLKLLMDYDAIAKSPRGLTV